MSQLQNNSTDDLLTRAVIAARQLPIPDGPSEVIVSRTLAAMDDASNLPKSWRWFYPLPWKSKAAALFGLAASALVAYVVLSASSGSAIVLAQVIDKIVSAKTLSYDLSIQAGGDNGFVAKGKLVFDESYNTRADLHVHYQNQEDDATLIINVDTGKSLLAIQKQKVAVVDLAKFGDRNFLKDAMINRFRALAKESSRSLGKKQIDGVEAEGFEIKRAGTTRFWVNTKTGDPLQLEIDDVPFPQPIARANFVINNFKLDGEVDSSLFNAEPPQGYVVIKSPLTIDLTGKPANDVATILRLYAKQSGGRFPERLEDFNDPIFKKFDTSADPSEKPSAENLELSLLQATTTRLQIYLKEHKASADYQYYPGGKLGEKDRLIFWYKDLKSDEYTALYGDLRVEKIAKEKLPPPPAASNDAKP